jgi:hypothetical protein
MTGDVFDVLIRALQDTTDEQLSALIRTLQSYQQQRKDNAVVRDIVADSRRSPPAQPSSAMGSDAHTHAQAKGGWAEPKRLDEWQKQVGIGRVDALMDAQDRRDRAAREREGR